MGSLFGVDIHLDAARCCQDKTFGTKSFIGVSVHDDSEQVSRVSQGRAAPSRQHNSNVTGAVLTELMKAWHAKEGKVLLFMMLTFLLLIVSTCRVFTASHVFVC